MFSQNYLQDSTLGDLDREISLFSWTMLWALMPAAETVQVN